MIAKVALPTTTAYLSFRKNATCCRSESRLSGMKNLKRYFALLSMTDVPILKSSATNKPLRPFATAQGDKRHVILNTVKNLYFKKNDSTLLHLYHDQ